jgi:hypothetical protein
VCERGWRKKTKRKIKVKICGELLDAAKASIPTF